MESENKLVFAVDRRATKVQIKIAVSEMYNAKVEAVNTRIGPDGEKYAYVKFGPETIAIDIATDMGLI